MGPDRWDDNGDTSSSSKKSKSSKDKDSSKNSKKSDNTAANGSHKSKGSKSKDKKGHNRESSNSHHRRNPSKTDNTEDDDLNRFGSFGNQNLSHNQISRAYSQNSNSSSNNGYDSFNSNSSNVSYLHSKQSGDAFRPLPYLVELSILPQNQSRIKANAAFVQAIQNRDMVTLKQLCEKCYDHLDISKEMCTTISKTISKMGWVHSDSDGDDIYDKSQNISYSSDANM